MLDVIERSLERSWAALGADFVTALQRWGGVSWVWKVHVQAVWGKGVPDRQCKETKMQCFGSAFRVEKVYVCMSVCLCVWLWV